MITTYPTDAQSLKIEIGKQILRDGLASMMPAAPIDFLVDMSPVANHIEAAERIRASDPRAVQELSRLATRALSSLKGGKDEALVSIMSDVSSSRALREWLSTPIPYLTDLIMYLSNRDEDDMRTILTAIKSYADGG